MDEKVKITFNGIPGKQSFSFGKLSFPAGQVVELEKFPNGLDDITLTETQRKAMGLKAGQEMFTIEGKRPAKKKVAIKSKPGSTKKKKGKPEKGWSGEDS